MRASPFASLVLVAQLAACGSSQVGSIGAVLSRSRATGAVHVREAPEGLAGAEGGLLEGDQVKMIDGILVDDLDAARIQRLLRGEVGSKVVLTIVRGDEVMHVEVTRAALGSARVPKDEEKIE
jgi:C-terminal processing protease CtpA/Prc